jgi:hypothetical protein
LWLKCATAPSRSHFLFALLSKVEELDRRFAHALRYLSSGPGQPTHQDQLALQAANSGSGANVFYYWE